MRPDKRTREQLLNEIDRLRRGSLHEEIGQTARALIAAACVAFVGWCVKESVLSLSGLDTRASISVMMLGRVEIAAVISAALGAGGVLYGWSQRSLRRKTVRRLQSRIQHFERRQDPRRSSSDLEDDGATNLEDR